MATSESGTGAPAAAEAAPAPAGWGDDDNGWGDDDNWDTPKPAVGSTTAQPTPTPAPDVHGVEALPGETDTEYVARQARLREEAAARMRAKFGGSGGLNGRMGGCGSGASAPVAEQTAGGWGSGWGLSSVLSGAAGIALESASGIAQLATDVGDVAGMVGRKG